MNKRERQEALLQMIGENPEINAAALAKAAGVSEVTVRKDLQQLAREGRIRRAYGRAYLAEGATAPGGETPSGKAAMGALAAGFVEDEDLIFIGPGHTGLALAKALREHRRLSVITMNISAAMALSETPEFKVLALPGDFTRRDGAYYVTGTAAMEYAQGLCADKVFVTADGFDLDRGFSVLDEITAQIYRALIKAGTKVYIFITHARLSRNARASLEPLQQVAGVITDARPEAAYMEAFRARGIEVYYPDTKQ